MRDRYWHNMAGRIQRAWRNYWRYKNESATRIQRFWKNNKEALVYAQVRDYGHQLLAGRKERRRFSLVSYRRFMGDYLGVGSRKNFSPLGGVLKDACGFAGEENILLSCRIQLLVSKLGRSSKPSPRYLVLVRPSLSTRLKCSADIVACRRIVRYTSLSRTRRMEESSPPSIARSTYLLLPPLLCRTFETTGWYVLFRSTKTIVPTIL